MARLFSIALILEITLTASQDVSVRDTLQHGSDKLTTNFFTEVVKENPDRSVIFSAFSVLTPLAQLVVASEGPTHDELLNAIGFPDDNTTIAAFSLINKEFESIGKDVELKMASRIYVPSQYQVRGEFAKVSQDVFNSDVATVNFNSANTADDINSWVASSTKDHINHIVDSDSLADVSGALLVNALYFKGTWKYLFENDKTKTDTFHVDRNKQIDIQMMYIDGKFRYGECEGLQSKLLEMYYVGEKTSLLVVLPTDTYGINQLLEKLKNPTALPECLKYVFSNNVHVSFPKYRTESHIDLKNILMNIKVTKIFNPKANLTKLVTPNDDLYVSSAIQKAFIEVDEHGAEATVVNTFTIHTGRPAIPMKEYWYHFTADHPFVFYLRANDITLFNGVFYGMFKEEVLTNSHRSDKINPKMLFSTSV